MSKKYRITDEDILIDKILTFLYNEGAFGWIYLNNYLKHADPNLNYTDKQSLALANTLRLKGLVDMTMPKNADSFPRYYEQYQMGLSEKAKHIIKEHGSYINYLTAKKPDEKSWFERNPTWDKIITGFITFIFSVATALLLFPIQGREKGREYTQQNERLNNLSDSVKDLQKQLMQLRKQDTTFLK